MALITRQVRSGGRSVPHARMSATRIVPIAAACAGLALSASALVSASGASVAKGKSAVVVKQVKNAKLGQILTTTKGFTLYRFTPDKANKVNCTGSCAALWPPLDLPAGATTPTGVSGLGTIKVGANLQVTYKGHPLYTYKGDKTAGATTGQNVEKTWFAVTPAVATLAVATTKSTTKAPAPSNTSAPTATPTTAPAPASDPSPTTTTTQPKPATTTTTTVPSPTSGYGY